MTGCPTTLRFGYHAGVVRQETRFYPGRQGNAAACHVERLHGDTVVCAAELHVRADAVPARTDPRGAAFDRPVMTIAGTIPGIVLQGI